MRHATVVMFALFLFLTGCSTKNVRVGGTMCSQGNLAGGQADPENQTPCTNYGPSEHKAAGEASYPPGTTPESGKTLEQQGYKITE